MRQIGGFLFKGCSRWARNLVMDVAAWLRDLGLEAYAEAFAENGVDAELLGELNNEDLKDLGVAKLADRKRLLNAIANLASDIPTRDARPSQPAMLQASTGRSRCCLPILRGSPGLRSNWERRAFTRCSIAISKPWTPSLRTMAARSTSIWATMSWPCLALRSPMTTIRCGRCAPLSKFTVRLASCTIAQAASWRFMSASPAVRLWPAVRGATRIGSIPLPEIR